MYKNYILPCIFCALTVVLVFASHIYSKKEKTGDELEYKVVFNSATIEQKIVGKHYTEIAKRYLPASEITKKKRKGTFTAAYKGVTVFTPGDSHVSYGMAVQFKDSVATAITLDEPRSKASGSAKILNLNPHVYKLINAEFCTRDVTAMKGRAKGWQIPFLLLLGILLILFVGTGGFLLVWPLVTLCSKRLPLMAGFFVGLVLIIIANWFWYPFVAYSQGNIGLYMIPGVAFILYAVYQLMQPLEDEYDAFHEPSGSGSSYQGSTERYPIAMTHEIAVNHFNHVMYLGWCVCNEAHERIPMLNDIGHNLGIYTEEWSRIMRKVEKEGVDPTIIIPSHEGLCDEFVRDYIYVLLSYLPVNVQAVHMAMAWAKDLGVNPEVFLGYLEEIASDDYNLELWEVTIC